jgi:hypothetical protein
LRPSFFQYSGFVLNQTNHLDNAGRSILTILRDADVSFLKLSPVRDRLAVQFRAECFSVSNTPQLQSTREHRHSGEFGGPDHAAAARRLRLIASG